MPPTRSIVKDLGAKRYVAAGDRAYVIGTANGAFPPMGWHITGQMGGVWAHPIKLLDGYWFRLGSTWLTDAQRLTAGPGFVEMVFPPTDGVDVTRTEFSPDGTPAVLVGLTLSNPTSVAKFLNLEMVARSELMAAYPWASSQPENAAAFNGHDRGEFEPGTGTLRFREPAKPWYALVRTSLRPDGGATGDSIWGPVSGADQSAYDQYGNGTGGRLTWRLKLRSRGQVTVWTAIAGSHTSEAEASSALKTALTDPAKLLAEKIAGRMELLRQTVINVPDRPLQQAFDWAKMNLADLRRTATDVRVRATAAGTRYPTPVRTLTRISGIGAGFPDYPWFFGADGAYTTHALVASGQWQTAMNHLAAIRDVSRAVNGNTGKVVHEVVTDGSVYFGANADAGDTNETAQFAIAADLLWRWTGDRGFLDGMYHFVDQGMHYITSSAMDPDRDGWPEGLGMVERPGMGAATLDVASYTRIALQSLADMAAGMGDRATERWAATRSQLMRSRFEKAWWSAKDSLYADSLCSALDAALGNVECSHAGQQLQQRYWIDATPMETGIAPSGHAVASLNRLQSSTFTGVNGLFHTGKGGGSDGQGELANWTLPNSVMAVAESNYGRVDQALFYMNAIAKLLDLEMPGALPEIAPSPAYDPFQPLTSRAMFMQAWSAYGIQWPVIHDFLGIDPDVPARTLSVVPDIPSRWPALSVSNLRVGSSTISVSARHEGLTYITMVHATHGDALTIGDVLPTGDRVLTASLDGHSVRPLDRRTNRGHEATVRTSANGSHTLVITLMKGLT